MKKIRFILASKSPRRREILENIGMNFTVIDAKADESSVSPAGIDTGLYVQELALLKAAACAKMVVTADDTIIISADTIVCMQGQILGKPKDEQDAYEMLKKLSGEEHSVFTGFCVMDIKSGKTVCRTVETKVRFKNLSDDDIFSYIKTKESMDKAGAYGIQGLGGLFVSEISGDYNNVVGLPVSCLSDVLAEEFGYSIIKEN